MRKLLAVIRIESLYGVRMILHHALVLLGYTFQNDLVVSLAILIHDLTEENRKLSYLLFYAYERKRHLTKMLKSFDKIKIK